MWSSRELRKSFLDFFAERGHIVVPSSSLIPERDPTLLFTSAGMVQFKPFYAGSVPLPYTRACSVQKCLRLTDIDVVGKTIRHDTFFEMLGNFSFGDYFKREAILWAWEFLVNILGMDASRLWISVYPEDDESFAIWRDEVGVPEQRIVKLEDNFWGPAGGTGACRPDTEIHFDLGEEFSGETPGDDGDRFLEVWNLVFPQFDQAKDGTRKPLKNRGVDTGMGLERLTMVMQNKKSIFETDLFFPIIEEATRLLDVPYKDFRVPVNIIADHIRALTFAIADGAIPSNEGRGYVIRRILRRAVKQGWDLECREPFLWKLVRVVVEIMGGFYPEIEERQNQVEDIIRHEEERFLKTIAQGMYIFTTVVKGLKEKGEKVFPGEEIFRLYDTYGFPADITAVMAGEQGFSVDMDGFEERMAQQRAAAKQSAKFVEEGGEWTVLKNVQSDFVGYNTLEVETEVVRYRLADEGVDLILAQTPFYGSAGGQVGDTGEIIGDGWRVVVEDTLSTEYGNIMRGKMVEGKFVPGKAYAKVDKKRRLAIQRNHTATHLLHSALRRILGEGVRQEGSLVAPTHLRFDFTHHSPLSPEELAKVEELVNQKIFEMIPVDVQELPFSKAKEMGAIALFGEKYGDIVRVVKIGDFSIELCGGTHLSSTAEVGLFKITSEGSVAAGIRRITAITGEGVYDWLLDKERLLKDVCRTVEASEDYVVERLQKLMSYVKQLERRIEKLQASGGGVDVIMDTKVGDIDLKVLFVDVMSREEMRRIGDRHKGKGIVILGSNIDGKAGFVVFVDEKTSQRIKAGDIAKELAKMTGGGGGGKPTLAESGGKEGAKVREVLESAHRIVEGLLK